MAAIITSAALSSLDEIQAPEQLDLNVTDIYHKFCSVCVDLLVTHRRTGDDKVCKMGNQTAFSVNVNAKKCQVC